jgi:hypothetical protein
MSESQPASDTPFATDAVAEGAAAAKGRGCLLTSLLISPAMFWALFLLVLLPAHQGAVVSIEQRQRIVVFSTIICTFTIPALVFTMGRWRVVYTIPLWAVILLGTVVACQQPYFTQWDRVCRHLGEEEKAAVNSLIELGATIWPNSQGQVDTVRFCDLRVSDDRLSYLEALPNLKHLSLNGQAVTDDMLASVRVVDRLESLDLYNTRITDAGLEHVKGLKQLRELNLTYTQVTDKGVKKLQEALPNCKIVR